MNDHKTPSAESGFKKQPKNDRVKSVLEMLHEISANGNRQGCSRESLLSSMNVWELDLNIKRMLEANLLEQMVEDSGIYYKIPSKVLATLYPR